jgi:hypothetical protein
MTVSSGQPPQAGGVSTMGHQPANLGDILERVLDRGLVIVGDIRVSLLDIELLTIKLRLLIASVDTARQLGIDWWENDPFLSSRAQARLAAAEARRRGQVETQRTEQVEAQRTEQVETPRRGQVEGRDENAEHEVIELMPEPRQEDRPENG